MDQLKIHSTLRIKEEIKTLDGTSTLAEEINLVTIPDDMSEEAIKRFFDKYRENMKDRYIDTLKDMVEVELKNIE